MERQMLDFIPTWLLLPFFALFALLAIETGYRAGRWRHARAAEEKEQPVGSMVAAILGLLAFMLAFTFSFAATRFESRREAVLEEANAIGTTFLRAGFLPQPQRDEVQRLLREYVDIRLATVRDGNVAEGIKQSERIQSRLWTQATQAVESNQRPVAVGQFIQSLNDVIDVHAKRVLVGLRSRVPTIIWGAMLSLAFVGIGSMGYQAGLSATRRSPAMVLLALAFALVLFLIADLDQSQSGLLRVSQAAIGDVQRSMTLVPAVQKEGL